MFSILSAREPHAAQPDTARIDEGDEPRPGRAAAWP